MMHKFLLLTVLLSCFFLGCEKKELDTVARRIPGEWRYARTGFDKNINDIPEDFELKDLNAPSNRYIYFDPNRSGSIREDSNIVETFSWSVETNVLTLTSGSGTSKFVVRKADIFDLVMRSADSFPGVWMGYRRN